MLYLYKSTNSDAKGDRAGEGGEEDAHVGTLTHFTCFTGTNGQIPTHKAKEVMKTHESRTLLALLVQVLTLLALLDRAGEGGEEDAEIGTLRDLAPQGHLGRGRLPPQGTHFTYFTGTK